MDWLPRIFDWLSDHEAGISAVAAVLADEERCRRFLPGYRAREAQVELAKGRTTGEVVRQLGITAQTYYRWRKEYGGLRLDQAKRRKELEKENSRLRKLLAEQALDDTILNEAASADF